jgi:hypothetical protein
MDSRTLTDDIHASEDLLEEVAETTLPAPVAELADEYDRVVGERDRFLWRWIYCVFPSFTLSSVPEEHYETARTQKTVLTMFTTLLDDLAENLGDRATFEEAAQIPYRPESVNPERDGVDAEQLRFIERVWTAFHADIAEAPAFSNYTEIFESDLRQTLTAIDYSRVVNEHVALANMTGIEQYDPHNMMMFPYADVDLMFSPGFEKRDLATVRRVIWDLQKMARIGNWVTTWERELHEGDYTAGPVIYALQQGIVSTDELDPEDSAAVEAVVERIRDESVEEKFVEEWWDRYESVMARDCLAESVDVNAFVEGMQTVLAYQLAARGYK